MALTSSSEAMPPVDLSISEAGMCAAATTNNTDALDPELAQEMVMSARVGDLDDFKSLMQLHSISLRDASLCRSLYGAQTAFHMAAANGHLETVQYLVSGLNGPADVNVTNEEGSTPLHWAALNGHIKIVGLLLEHGASATLKNKAGKSAVTVSAQANHIEIMDLLLKSFDPDDENEEELSAVAESTAQLAAAHGFENVTVRFEDDSDANDVDMVASTSIER
ncbi:hypothetical protein BASA61_005189 [Batrachochytrium salamandrivorans]|nr:hypothetical protein BASA60_007909 [Batrachochytrium salamandrivorans]KAH6590669.1 hypothetical protein BASA61_005189 [Batrachochytrium salamandrivorans]